MERGAGVGGRGRAGRVVDGASSLPQLLQAPDHEVGVGKMGRVPTLPYPLPHLFPFPPLSTPSPTSFPCPPTHTKTHSHLALPLPSIHLHTQRVPFGRGWGGRPVSPNGAVLMVVVMVVGGGNDGWRGIRVGLEGY